MLNLFKPGGSKIRAMVFVDYESWFYSYKKLYNMRPDPKEFRNKLKAEYDIEDITASDVWEALPECRFMSASAEPLQKSWRSKVAQDRMAKVFPVWPNWYPQTREISFSLRAAVPVRLMPRA